eukprot:scaffold16992_cov140-Skeletonema_marinoi.AAC.8
MAVMKMRVMRVPVNGLISTCRPIEKCYGVSLVGRSEAYRTWCSTFEGLVRSPTVKKYLQRNMQAESQSSGLQRRGSDELGVCNM